MPRPERLESIDLVRGIAMILMALDHTRDFFGTPGVDPTNLASASAALFVTRWITHLCAPTFFLLTGVGARLALRHRSPAQVSRFLVTRGLWLLLLETVVIRCAAYQFNVDYRVTMLLVLWALGWSMIVLAGLLRFHWAVAAAFGGLLIVGHHAFDGIQAGPLWSLLHGPGVVLNLPGHIVFAAYPLVPWIGVTAVGFAAGGLYGLESGRRRAALLYGGLAMIGAFVALRLLNGYGDPAPWSGQASRLSTFLSFLNTTKYPPSLLFLLMTLGPAWLLLRIADRGVPAGWRPAVTMGRVPLFYYGAHFFLLHLLAVVICLMRYGTAHWMFESPDLARYPFTPPPGWGYPLPVVYTVWLLVVGSLYPLCRWFGRLKRERPDGWLSYL